MPFNRLTVSLLLVVVTGVVGLGFLIGQAHDALESKNAPAEDLAYRALGAKMAQTIGRSADMPAALEAARIATGFDVSLVAQQDLPLPTALALRLDAGEPLLLQAEGVESDRALSVYIAIPQSDQLLVLNGLPVEEQRNLGTVRLLLTLAFYAGLLGVVVLWLAPLLRRLDALGRVTRSFGRGQLQQRVATSRRSYIAAIERDFNAMADHLQLLIADNKLLSQAVSRDLKTPLARLRFGVEMIIDCDDAQERGKYAHRAESDLQQMESLIDTLLNFARMEENRPNLDLCQINLQPFLERLLLDSGSDELELKLLAVTDSAAFVQGDLRFLPMLFSNVINPGVANNFGPEPLRCFYSSI